MKEKRTLDEMLELIKKFPIKEKTINVPKERFYRPEDDIIDYGFMKYNHKDRKLLCFSY